MPDTNKKADKTTAISVIQMFAGVFLIILFGIFALIGMVRSLIADVSSSLPTLLFLLNVIVGVFFIWKGYLNYKLASRFRRISRAMGDNTDMELSELAQKLGWKHDKLLRALRQQRAHGFWPDSYLDTDNGTFVLGYTPAYLKTDSGNQVLDELLGAANKNIHEMATVNRSIEDQDLKARAEALIDIAKQIYSYIEKYPDKSSQVRQLSSYFLPTTANLLKDYLELQNQPVKSESMLTSMEKIKDMMGRIEAAFNKELNDLYSGKAMDVAVEIEVMDNMLDM